MGETLRRLRELETRLSRDAPPWAELLGMWLVAGATLRTGLHAWVALLGGEILGDEIDPRIDGHDMTMRSPVAGLRGHRLEPIARGVVVFVGVAGWELFDPIGATSANPAVGLWLGGQLAWCLADAGMFLAVQLMEVN